MSREYQIIWSRIAHADLAGIIEYIAYDSPTNAKKILKTIRNKAANLYISPQRGRIIPELQEQGIVQYREIIIKSWRVIYRIDDDSVLVLSVIDARQNVEDILLARLTKS